VLFAALLFVRARVEHSLPVIGWTAVSVC